MNDQTNNQRAMDRLTDQDRVLSTEAIMLPIDKPLNEEQVDAVRQAVRDFITDDAGVQMIPNNQVAAEIGFSPSVISDFMKGKYRGDNERLARQLNLWLDRHRKRERSQGRREYISTWACERMAAFVRLADRRQKLCAVIAPSGSGKDMIIDVLAEELGGHLIYCDQLMTGARLVQAVAEAIGLKPINDSHQLMRRVIKRLKGRSTIIFLNEAQTLMRRGVGSRCLSVIRSLYDQTGVVFALFGSAEIMALIDDRDPASGGGQAHRRFLRCNLLNLAAQEADPDKPDQLGRPLFSRDEVRSFLAMKQVKLADADAFELLYQVANLTEHGTLGLCGDVIDAIADLWPGDAITREHVFSALAMQLDTEADVVQAKIEAAQGGNRRLTARAG